MKRMVLMPESGADQHEKGQFTPTEQAGRIELYNTDRNVLKQLTSLDFIEYILKNVQMPADKKVKLIQTALQHLIVGKEQGKGGSVDTATGKPSVIHRMDSLPNGFDANEMNAHFQKSGNHASSSGHESEETIRIGAKPVATKQITEKVKQQRTNADKHLIGKSAALLNDLGNVALTRGAVRRKTKQDGSGLTGGATSSIPKSFIQWEIPRKK